MPAGVLLLPPCAARAVSTAGERGSDTTLTAPAGGRRRRKQEFLSCLVELPRVAGVMMMNDDDERGKSLMADRASPFAVSLRCQFHMCARLRVRILGFLSLVCC